MDAPVPPPIAWKSPTPMGATAPTHAVYKTSDISVILLRRENSLDTDSSKSL